MKMMTKYLFSFTVLLMVVALVSCGGNKLQEQLDLGQKYLAEMDYENALIAFEEAIKINEKSVEAYIGAADAYMGLGQPNKAIDILNTGYEKTGDDIISTKKQEIDEQKKTAEMLQPVDKLSEFVINDDLDSINEFFNSENYNSILDWIKYSGQDRYIYGAEPNRIGIYLVNEDSLMIYIGEYDGDNRAGEGSWIGKNYYAKGSWENDKPNGIQKIVFSTSIETGNVKDGLWDGNVEYNYKDHGDVFDLQFNAGVVVVIDYVEESEGGNYVVAYERNKGENSRYVFNEEQKNGTHGIRGFADYAW